jgi:site-specific recombinase XerD
LKEVAKPGGIDKRITSHMRRHTFATTISLSNGVPIESVSKMLGHTSIKTTQIYARILNSKISNDMDVLAEKLKDMGTKYITN